MRNLYSVGLHIKVKERFIIIYVKDKPDLTKNRYRTLKPQIVYSLAGFRQCIENYANGYGY